MSSPRVFDFFDEILCINLPEAKDRWEQTQQEFEDVGVVDRVTRIPAIRPHNKCAMPKMTHPIGEFGAWLSHGKALIHAIESGAENVLIVEDDVMFKPWVLDTLPVSISQLPDDYGIFFLTGTPAPPLTRCSSHLAKIETHFYGAVAYCVPRRSMLKLYNTRLEMVEKRVPVADAATSVFAAKNNGYAAIPYACMTHPGMSLVRNANRNHDKAVAKVWRKIMPDVFDQDEYK